MEVVVDGKTGMGVPDGSTFGQLFEQIRKSVASKRRVVVAYVLDGEGLSPDRQAVLSGQTPGDYGLLEVRTADPFQFSLSTLTGLVAHLGNMGKTQEEACASVGSGEFTKAMEKFEAVYHGWDILVRAVRDVGQISTADFRSLKAGGEPVDERIRQVQDSLLRFTAALELKDLPRAAELVQDELRSHHQRFRGVLEALSQHVARMSGVAQG